MRRLLVSSAFLLAVLGLSAFIAYSSLSRGYHLAEMWRHPSMESVIRALLFLCIPLSLAWMINRRLRVRSDDACRV